MKAKEIIKESRYILSDKSADRWSDDRLLTLLNDGILDIAKNTTLFVETLIYAIPNLVPDIDLTSQALKIVRVEYLDVVIPFYSFEEMDKKGPRLWQHETGTEVKAIVYDKQKNMVLKLYPIITNSFNPHISYNSLFGIVTDISYSDIQPVVMNRIGDIANIPDKALLKFYYVRKHAKITDINTDLNIDDLVKNPLTHYIAGMALRDNQVAQNLNFASQEIQIYAGMIEDYNIQKSKLYVNADYGTGYNSMG